MLCRLRAGTGERIYDILLYVAVGGCERSESDCHATCGKFAAVHFQRDSTERGPETTPTTEVEEGATLRKVGVPAVSPSEDTSPLPTAEIYYNRLPSYNHKRCLRLDAMAKTRRRYLSDFSANTHMNPRDYRVHRRNSYGRLALRYLDGVSRFRRSSMLREPPKRRSGPSYAIVGAFPTPACSAPVGSCTPCHPTAATASHLEKSLRTPKRNLARPLELR